MDHTSPTITDIKSLTSVFILSLNNVGYFFIPKQFITPTSLS